MEHAALLLMSLGDDAAAQVMSHFSPRELKEVTRALAGMREVTEDQVGTVVESFRRSLKGQTPLGARASDFTRRVLASRLGDDKAGAVWERFQRSEKIEPLEPLLWIEPRELAEALQDEHPQVVASVLGLLEAEQAAEVIRDLPQPVATEAVIRLAQLDEISPGALREIEALFAHRLSGEQTSKPPAAINGARSLAGVVNHLDGETEQLVLDALRDVDEKLAENVEELMFVFENLADLDDRGFQALLREISNELLVPALKGCAPALRERFFGNMSRRAAEMLRDDLEVAGPTRLSDVEAAQKEVLAAARRLADAGTISLGGKGGEEFV